MSSIISLYNKPTFLNEESRLFVITCFITESSGASKSWTGTSYMLGEERSSNSQSMHAATGYVDSICSTPGISFYHLQEKPVSSYHLSKRKHEPPLVWNSRSANHSKLIRFARKNNAPAQFPLNTAYYSLEWCEHTNKAIQTVKCLPVGKQLRPIKFEDWKYFIIH